MTNLQKSVGDTATFTAVVKNAEGVVLPGYEFTFTSDTDTVTAVDGQDATVVGSTVETVTVTATTVFPDGTEHSAEAAVDFVDNTPATVEVTAS
jgi:hypothetical protein